MRWDSKENAEGLTLSSVTVDKRQLLLPQVPVSIKGSQNRLMDLL